MLSIEVAGSTHRALRSVRHDDGVTVGAQQGIETKVKPRIMDKRTDSQRLDLNQSVPTSM